MVHEYNTKPDHLREISEEEFMKDFFHYSLKEPVGRQVREKNGNQGYNMFRLRMFDIHHRDEVRLGIAVMEDSVPDKFKHFPAGSHKRYYRFCRYGSDEEWSKFRKAFAMSFAGDNS